MLAVVLGGCGDDDPPANDTLAPQTSTDSGGGSEQPDPTDGAESPDDTADGDTDASTGQPGVCGDGNLDPGEECDDGNTFDIDGCDSMCRIESADDLPFDVATFAASHNSYVGGEVGSVIEQLDAGVRFLEFDLHTDDYANAGYRIGHDAPGDEVAMGGGNPSSFEYGAWLSVVANWSDAHPGHAPITVLVDFKDQPSSDSYAAGNLAAFNDLLIDSLGADRLYTPGDLADAGGTWPTVAQMQDRVVVVLSGNQNAQLDYRRDRGDDPALAINASGQVVAMHVSQSDGDRMWLWTGQVADDGTIAWRRHARHDTGNKPAVAINNAGVVVEVHEDPDFGDDQLWYRVGQLDADYEIQWATEGGQTFPGDDSGVSPTVIFTDLDTLAVREVHQSENNRQRWYWSAATIDTAAGTIDWVRPQGDGTTDDPLYPKTIATHDGTDFEITAGDDGPFTQVLRVQGRTTHRVRYEQLAFGSATRLDSAELVADGLMFFGDDATNLAGVAFVQEMKEAGMITRLWKFEPDSTELGPVNYPATDTPLADWYLQMCDIRVCAE